MKHVVGLSALVVALSVGLSSMPANAAKDAEEHAANHPAGTAVRPESTPAGYDEQMKTMQQMHQQMAAAKTPEERAALMNDHMKAMQGGMGMMGQMRGGMMGGGMMGGKKMEGSKGAMSMDPEMMKRRMDMMEMMMQMMMDREGMTPPAPK